MQRLSAFGFTFAMSSVRPSVGLRSLPRAILHPPRLGSKACSTSVKAVHSTSPTSNMRPRGHMPEGRHWHLGACASQAPKPLLKPGGFSGAGFAAGHLRLAGAGLSQPQEAQLQVQVLPPGQLFEVGGRAPRPCALAGWQARATPPGPGLRPRVGASGWQRGLGSLRAPGRP
jgi:hypothetical protein